MRKKLIFIVLSVVLSLTLWAQDDSSEADSSECSHNYTEFSESFEANNTSEALKYWRACFTRCQQISKNIYISGAKLLEAAIKKETDPLQKAQLIDTLFLLYERRVELYGEEGKVLGYKAEDLIKYRPDDVDLAYQMMERSIMMETYKSRGKILSSFLQLSLAKLKKNELEKIDFVEIYGVVADIVEFNLLQEPDDKFYIAAKKIIDDIYNKEIHLDCDGITALFRSRYEENQNDVDFLRRIKSLLEVRKCKDGDLYNLTVQSLIESDPNTESLVKMAEYHQSRNEMTKAIEYYKKAIAKEIDKGKKAELYYKLAETTSINPTLAVMYCNNAIELKPSFARPYLLIAHHYAKGSSRCGKGSKYPEFMKKTMYWAAVDKCNTAKKLDPKLTEEADKMIAEFSVNFPTLEEITFQGLQIGSTYVIDCWINSSTIVRINNGQ